MIVVETISWGLGIHAHAHAPFQFLTHSHVHPSHLIYIDACLFLDQPTHQKVRPHLSHTVPPAGIVVSDSRAHDIYISAGHNLRSSPWSDLAQQSTPPTTNTTTGCNPNSSPVQLLLGVVPSWPIYNFATLQLTTYNLQVHANANQADCPAINYFRPHLLASVSSAHHRPDRFLSLISLKLVFCVIALSPRRHSLPPWAFCRSTIFPAGE